MKNNLPNNLIDAVDVMLDAIDIREERLNKPNREPDETTEEDVFESLRKNGASNYEALVAKRAYTRAVRIMIRGGVKGR